MHLSLGGHLRPLMPLVRALQERGARTVQWAAPAWESECLAAGGEFRALPDVGVDLEDASPRLVAVAARLGAAAERLAPWLAAELRTSGAEVVLRDTLAHYARYAAYDAGLPQVAFSAAMAFPARILRALKLSPAQTARRLPVALGQLAAGAPEAVRLRRVSRRLERRYGVALGGWLEVFAGRDGGPTLVGTSRGLQVLPQALGDERLRFVGPLRAASAPAGGEEPALAGLDEREQLVYVSLGTVFEERPEFFRAAAWALARPGRRVVMSVGRVPASGLGSLPAGVTAHTHVDQIAVLRQADLFITHGGFNGVQEGLVAGVPLLVFPQMREQALNAERICELGAGLRLRRPTPARIAAMAERILADSRFRAAARSAGAELRAAVDLDGAVDEVLAARLPRAATTT